MLDGVALVDQEPAQEQECRAALRRDVLARRRIPRQLNNLATQSLIAASAEQKAIVDQSAAQTAVTEVTAE